MGQYRLSLAADQDFEQIFEYGLDSVGVHVAVRYQKALSMRFTELAENPMLYPTTDLREGYRRSVCGAHSIYYRLNGDEIEIVRILGRHDANAQLP